MEKWLLYLVRFSRSFKRIYSTINLIIRPCSRFNTSNLHRLISLFQFVFSYTKQLPLFPEDSPSVRQVALKTLGQDTYET